MLRKLIGRIKAESKLDERIVWGILAVTPQPEFEPFSTCNTMESQSTSL